MPFTAWKHTETETSIYYDFVRVGDSSTVPDLLKQEIACIRACLDTIQNILIRSLHAYQSYTV